MENLLTSASHHAMLFAYIAKETIEAFGEAGKVAVTEGVKRYGKQRGQRMALRTLADGNETNVMNYLVYGEWEALPGQMDLRFPAYEPEVRMQNYKCPWHTEWSKRGLLDYGYYYCKDVDAALARGYNGMDLSLVKNRVMGDECCDFIFRENGIAASDMQKFQELKQKVGNKAKMPWEYHTGHLYKTMREAVETAFGSEGTKAIERALKDYEQEYGKEATQLVLDYANIDYDVMPAYEGKESKDHE